MTASETKRPRSVLAHRRGLVPNHQERENLVSQPTSLLNPPDDTGLVKYPSCPPWCIGHHPGDGDEAVCIPNFYDWVVVGSDDVTVTVSQNVGEQAKVCLFPGASDVRGVRLAVAETDKVITLLVAARRVIDPAYSPSAVLHLIDPPQAA